MLVSFSPSEWTLSSLVVSTWLQWSCMGEACAGPSGRSRDCSWLVWCHFILDTVCSCSEVLSALVYVLMCWGARSPEPRWWKCMTSAFAKLWIIAPDHFFLYENKVATSQKPEASKMKKKKKKIPPNKRTVTGWNVSKPLIRLIWIAMHRFCIRCDLHVCYLKKTAFGRTTKKGEKLGVIPAPSRSNDEARWDWTRDATFSRSGFVGSDTQDLLLNST